MTHSQPHAGEPGRAPSPTFFDPSFERLPAPVAGETAAPGPVLLLFDRAADRDWAADAAVSLATGWHAAGRRTVLADLCLEDPFLNDRIGMPNQDGVVDIFLYGASLGTKSRRAAWLSRKPPTILSQRGLRSTAPGSGVYVPAEIR